LLKHCGLDKKVEWLKVQLMPDHLPINKIKVEISSFDSNKWIFIPGKERFADDAKNDKGEEMSRDVEKDPFRLSDVKKKAMNQSHFGCCCMVPVEMDERIIESGLKVLKSNREFKAKSNLERQQNLKKEKFEQKFDQLFNEMQQQGLKIEQKFDQLMNHRRNS
jgi:hypothetical protein